MHREAMVRCADCNFAFPAGEEACPACGADKPIRWGIVLPAASAVWVLILVGLAIAFG